MNTKIIFFLVFIFSINLVSAQSEYDTTSFTVVDKSPEFKHKNYKTFREFVVDGIVVTDKIKEAMNGVQKYYFSYVVDKEGKITNVELFRGENDELAKLIINRIESSPPWKPAIIKREPVDLKMSIAISFQNK